jgi:putative transposase
MDKNNSNTVFSCKYHIVWCTKYRKKLLHFPIDKISKEALFEIVDECRCVIIRLKRTPRFLRNTFTHLVVRRLVK